MPEGTSAPSNKITAVALGGAATTILLYLIELFTHVSVPGPVGAAIATVLTFLCGYLTRESSVG